MGPQKSAGSIWWDGGRDRGVGLMTGWVVCLWVDIGGVKG